MAVNAQNVLTGAPDQATTGAILSAPIGTEVPTSITEELDPAFTGSGYVNEDGLTLSTERSLETIRDWSGAIVRQILSEFGGTIAWSHLETNAESLRNYFGDDNVDVQEATEEHGRLLTARLRGTEMPRKPYVFRMKDGKARVLIVVPDGQVTETGDVEFVKSGAISWPVTLTTYPDSDGVNLYLYLDDGQVITGSTEGTTSGTLAAPGDDVPARIGRGDDTAEDAA